MKIILLKLLTCLFFLCFISSCSVSKINHSNYRCFARIKDNKFIFNIDTASYKHKVQNEIFKKENYIINDIQIVKQLTLGKKSEFYYILLKDKTNCVRVAKWLKKINNKLYTNDVLEEGDLFEQSYLVCVGLEDCFPNVFETDSIKQWGCSENVSCFVSKEAAEEAQKRCKSYKAIILN